MSRTPHTIRITDTGNASGSFEAAEYFHTHPRAYQQPLDGPGPAAPRMALQRPAQGRCRHLRQYDDGLRLGVAA
ncbi:hypothetical protein D3C85_837030 [compost metagenome]